MNNPKEKMKLNIELADNGIILRNPDCEDEISVVATIGDSDGYRICKKDLSNEYRAIGEKIYDWLLGEVIEKHGNDLIITNFD